MMSEAAVGELLAYLLTAMVVLVFTANLLAVAGAWWPPQNAPDKGAATQGDDDE